MRTLLLALLLVGVAQAATFNVTGTCMNDSLSNDTYCGDAPVTVVFNITENVTYNVTENITYNITQNVTVVQNVTYNLTTNITQNVTENRTVPSDFCYENANQQLAYPTIYRSDKCNITIIPQPPQTINQTVYQNNTCPVCREVFCPDTITDCNEPVSRVVENYTLQLSAKETEYKSQMEYLTNKNNQAEQRIIDLKNATSTGEIAAKKAVDDQMWPVPWLLAACIAVALVAIAGVLYHTAQERKFHSADLLPPALTKEEERQIGNAGTEKNIWDGDKK